MRRFRLLLICGVVLSAAAGKVFAGDRDFLYSYESNVMGPGEKELETYTTYRFGRAYFYSALDQSLEFETGLGDEVQTSLYLNFTQAFTRDETGGASLNTQGPVLDGVASEWKFKLMDSVGDSFGLGLIVEPEFEPDELDVETRLIVDKKDGSWLGTFNLTAEPQFDYADTQSSMVLTPSLGVGFFPSGDKFFVGLEAIDQNVIDSNPLRSVFSLGPIVQYSGQSWWVALTVLPQMTDFTSGTLNLDDSQRVQVRLATSVEI